MRALNRLLWRLQYEKSKRVALDQLSVFAGREGVEAFHRFDRYLTERTGTRLEPLHRLRMREIDSILQAHDVKSVLEMGAGRTTYFFNLYANLDVVSYEQDARWREIILAYYETEGMAQPRIVLSDVERHKNGGRFTSLQHLNCDLLYIDGPYVDLGVGRPATRGTKPVYYDFERVLEAGLPKVIMVEGRTATVDELLRSPHAKNYDFRGELTWALERGRYAQVLHLSRHSIFVRMR